MVFLVGITQNLMPYFTESWDTYNNLTHHSKDESFDVKIMSLDLRVYYKLQEVSKVIAAEIWMSNTCYSVMWHVRWNTLKRKSSVNFKKLIYCLNLIIIQDIWIFMFYFIMYYFLTDVLKVLNLLLKREWTREWLALNSYFSNNNIIIMMFMHIKQVQCHSF